MTATLPSFTISGGQTAAATTSAFLAAIATPNATVHIAGNVQVVLDGLERIAVARGVQIIGDRSQFPVGPTISTSTFPSALFVLGDHVRLSGVRVRGGESDDPFSAVGQSDPPVGPAVLFSNAPIPPITIWVSALPNSSECNG